jgi:hypothetical protein
LKAVGAKGAPVKGNLTKGAQQPSATGARRDRFFPRVIKALRLALRLYLFTVPALPEGPMKCVKQIGSNSGRTIGALVEFAGVGNIYQ